MFYKFNLSGLALICMLATLGACGGKSSGSAAASSVAVITAQPTDQSVVVNATATFTVVSTAAIGYQWQRSSDGGANFTNISGATTASHTTAATILSDSGTQYRAVVSGANNSITSSAATLTVTAAAVAPSISVHPANQTITEGQNASFSVTAGGTSITYNWQRSTDGGASFADIAGATNATLTLTAVPLADNTNQFRVVVSNSIGSVTSNTALLTVNAATAMPAFTLQPVSVTVVAPNAATFSVAVTGMPVPTLQWQLSTDGGSSFADIAGASATGTSYTTPATTPGDNNNMYRVVATNGSGTTISNVVTLNINLAVVPSFTAQPANVTITEGNNAYFTVAISGTPTPALQWQLSTDNGSNWSNINGATSVTLSTLNVTLADSGRQFRAVATNGSGTVNSSAAILTVNVTPPPPPSISATYGKVAVGQFHTCAVKADATLACWGHGSSREVLPAGTSDYSTPQTVPGLANMTQVAVGYQESCAIDTVGTLSCWGGGRPLASVKDGNGVPFAGVKGLAKGSLHTCFIDANTNVQCFGRNFYGQLGDGSTADPLDPYVAVPVFVRRYNDTPLTDVVSLSAGDTGNSTCALTSGGEVICWGTGPIGDSSTSARRAVVPAISSGATLMTAGGSHACAVLVTGELKCWGANSTYQLGNRSTTDQPTPVSVIDLAGLLNGVTSIAVGTGYTCAIPASGRVVCWGAIDPGRINGTNTISPTEKGNLASRVTLIASGGGPNNRSCALVADGSMECWGSNQYGQLGLGHMNAINTGGPTPPSTSVIGGAIFWK